MHLKTFISACLLASSITTPAQVVFAETNKSVEKDQRIEIVATSTTTTIATRSWMKTKNRWTRQKRKEERGKLKRTKKNLQVTIMYLKTLFFAACLFAVSSSSSSSVATPANKKNRVEKDQREKKSRRARESRQQRTGAAAAATRTVKRKGVSARVHACGEGYEWMNGG